MGQLKRVGEVESNNLRTIVDEELTRKTLDSRPDNTPDVKGEDIEWGNLLKQGWFENTIPGAMVKSTESRNDIYASVAFDSVEATQKLNLPSMTEEESDLLSRTHGERQFNLRLAEVMETREYHALCADSGVVPTLLTAGASSLADPTLLLVGLGEGVAIAKFGKSIVSASIIAGATNVAQEAVIDHMLHNRTTTDYVMSGALPLGFGVAGKGISKVASVTSSGVHAAGKLKGVVTSKVDDVTASVKTGVDKLNTMTTNAKGTIIKGTGTAKDFVHDKAAFVAPMMEQMDDAFNVVRDTYKKLRVKEAMESSGSLGAAAGRPIKRKGDNFMTPLLKRLGSDYQNLSLRGIGSLTKFADTHLSNAIGTGGRVVREKSTALLSAHYDNILKTKAGRPLEVLKRQYKNDAEFDYKLCTELNARRRGLDSTDDEIIKQAADIWNEGTRLESQMGTKLGVKRFVDQELDVNYFRQSWKGDKINELKRINKGDNVRQGLQDAIVRAMNKALPDEADIKTAGKMASAIMDRETNRASGQATISKGISGEWTREVLAKNGMTPEEIESTMKTLAGKDKAVIHLDYSTPIPGTNLIVQDLLDTGATQQMNRRLTTSAGDIALARNGIVDDDAWDAQVKEIIKEVELKNGSDDAQKVSKILELQRRLLRGESSEEMPDSATANGLRRMRDTFAIQVLNQMAFPQLAELGRVVGSVGLQNFIHNFPGFKNFVYKVRNMDGTARTELIRDMEASGMSVGADYLLNPKNFRTGEISEGVQNSKLGQVFDQGTAWARKQQSRWSGMDNIMDSQHQSAVTGIANKMFVLAKKGVEPDETFKRRLRDMTLSDAEIKAVWKELAKGTTDTNSKFGHAKTLNMDLWDADIKDTFQIALSQYTHNIIQKDLTGESMWWLGSTLGKTAMQFKKFPMLAFEKQLLHDVKFADAEVIKTLAYGLAMSTAAYHAKTYFNAMGRPDSDKYLEKRLTGSALVAGSIKYAGQLSLAPEVVQLMMGVTGMGDYNDLRGPVSIAPSLQGPVRAVKGVRGAAKMILPTIGDWNNDMSFQDTQNMFGITGINSSIQGRTVFNMLGSAMEAIF